MSTGLSPVLFLLLPLVLPGRPRLLRGSIHAYAEDKLAIQDKGRDTQVATAVLLHVPHLFM